MCLLGTAQLLNPWNQTGYHHPYFLVTLFLKSSSCFLSPKPSKTWFTKDTSLKKNVVCSTVETELSWANSLSNTWQMSCITVFPLKIKRFCSTSMSLLQSYRVPLCTVWEPNVFTKFLLFAPLHSAPQFIQSYSQNCSVSDQKKKKKSTKKNCKARWCLHFEGHFNRVLWKPQNNNRITKPEVLKINLVILRDWLSDAHLRALSGCEGEAMPSTWPAPDDYRNYGGGKG